MDGNRGAPFGRGDRIEIVDEATARENRVFLRPHVTFTVEVRIESGRSPMLLIKDGTTLMQHPYSEAAFKLVQRASGEASAA